MLCVNANILPSPIHGIGLFAAERIPEGTPIWKFVPDFDQVLSEEQILALPKIAQTYLSKYAYLSKKTNRYILDSDNGRFFNHSDTPNTVTKPLADEIENVIFARIDIEEGEEITLNYEDQEANISEGNVLAEFYGKYNLMDEVDPRLKESGEAI